MTSPDLALVTRFRADMLRLAPEAEDTATLALAVSGGPDSMAMLALAAAAFPGRVSAATVDHGLRPESADEAAMVASCCTGLGVEHATLAIAVPPGASGNLQAWARHERYALLRRWAAERGARFLCTAHHADDQAETFVMRAARGAGVAGLAGIRAWQELPFSSVAPLPDAVGWKVDEAPLVLLRPLLGWRRAALREIAIRVGLPCVDDPGNADERFERARVRAWLGTAPWLDAAQVARAAANLAAVDADFRALCQWLWRERVRAADASGVRIDVAELPREVRRRLARMAIIFVEAQERDAREVEQVVSSENVEHLLDALERGSGAMHGEVQASADGTVWHFREAPPRRSR